MIPKRWHPELIGLILVAFATRIWTLLTPNSVVFDEVYFKQFAAHYLDGHYYFDIHPPLGKLMLAGFGHLIGLTPDAMLNGTATSLRFLPAAAGILLIPLIWGILRRLGASRPFAFLGAAAVLLDNALLVESRFILMDSMLLLFGFGAVYLYLVARDSIGRARWLALVLAALSAGAATSIKWTGLNALAIIGLLWLWDQRSRPINWRKRLSEAAILVFLPILVYTSAFWLHFQLLPSSGDGDAFMSARYQSTLLGNPNYNPAVHLSFPDKFWQLNLEMFRANQTLNATHPYGSRWYTWPLELRPIYYWEGDQLANSHQGNIYLLGNPVIWWGVWLAIISGLYLTWLTRRRLRRATIFGLGLATSAYFINYLPFVGVMRVMFLYHYFFSFIWCLICAALLWNDLATDRQGRTLAATRPRQIYAVVLALIVLGFLYFVPLTYGLPMSPSDLQAHMWLQSWR